MSENRYAVSPCSSGSYCLRLSVDITGQDYIARIGLLIYRQMNAVMMVESAQASGSGKAEFEA